MENLTIEKNVPMPPVVKTGNRVKQDSRAYSMCKRGDTEGKFILRAIYPSQREENNNPVFWRVWRVS